jgi:hypothetical protein
MRYFLGIFFLSIVLSSFSQDASNTGSSEAIFRIKILNDLLKQHVNTSGTINYKNLKKTILN